MTQPTAPAPATERSDERPEYVQRLADLDLGTQIRTAPAYAAGAFQAAITVELAVREADHDRLPVPPEVRAMTAPLLAWAKQLTELREEVAPQS